MILHGKSYDTVKAIGKWVLPILLVILPIVQAFIDNGDFSAVAVVSLVIAVLTVVANLLQTVSKSNYKAEEEVHG